MVFLDQDSLLTASSLEEIPKDFPDTLRKEFICCCIEKDFQWVTLEFVNKSNQKLYYYKVIDYKRRVFAFELDAGDTLKCISGQSVTWEVFARKFSDLKSEFDEDAERMGIERRITEQQGNGGVESCHESIAFTDQTEVCLRNKVRLTGMQIDALVLSYTTPMNLRPFEGKIVKINVGEHLTHSIDDVP